MKLYVAGDSFASICKNQDVGKSFSEILARQLNCELINVSRPAASNTSIAIQVDYISQHIEQDDYCIILLTNHYRATLPDTTIVSNKNLLERHSVYYDQIPYKGINFSEKPELISSMLHHKDTKDFYKKYFDVELFYFKDKMMVTGCLTFLKQKTEKFLVLSGGFGLSDNPNSNSIKSKNNFNDVYAKDFCLTDKNFLNITSSYLYLLGDNDNFCNHLDDTTHVILANMLYKKLIENEEV